MTPHNDVEDQEEVPTEETGVHHIIQHHVVADLPGIVFLALATVIGDLFGSAEFGFGIGATLVLIARGTN